jgi:hypothetical protein
MSRRLIKSIAGLQRAWKANNRRTAALYKRPYILRPALAKHFDEFERLDQIDDDVKRYQAFRSLPALEFELEAIYAGLTPRQLKSLAQQDRAKRPRVHLTRNGHTLQTIIVEILMRVEDPWRQKAKQYWRPMVDRLQELGLNPVVRPDTVHQPNETLEYGYEGMRRSLTPRQFENIVSKVRRCLSRGLN